MYENRWCLDVSIFGVFLLRTYVANTCRKHLSEYELEYHCDTSSGNDTSTVAFM